MNTIMSKLHIPICSYQDFYSHSNWVELGYTETYINLIMADQPLEGMAGS